MQFIIIIFKIMFGLLHIQNSSKAEQQVYQYQLLLTGWPCGTFSQGYFSDTALTPPSITDDDDDGYDDDYYDDD